jgi:transcriptional regulator with XRE-family HTH domain
MTYQPFSDPNMPREIGHRLKLERIKQGLSVEDLCKKMGTRVQQIEAIESGSEVYFQKNSNSFTWFASLYAKILGINFPIPIASFTAAIGHFIVEIFYQVTSILFRFKQ